MTQIVELDGYIVKEPNSIYFGKKKIKIPGKFDLVPILFLERYSEPTPEDLINMAQVKALEHLEDSYKETNEGLEQIISELPSYVLQNIVNEDRYCLDSIRKGAADHGIMSVDVAKRRLKVISLFGPSMLSKLNLSKEQLYRKLDKYSRKIAKDLWNFDLTLTLRDEKFPPKKLIDKYIRDKGEVFETGSLKFVLREFFCYSEIIPVVEMIYSALQSEKEITLIPETTEELVKEALEHILICMVQDLDEEQESVDETIKKVVYERFRGKRRFGGNNPLWSN